MARTGFHHSDETKRKIALANRGKTTGHVPWNKGIKGCYDDETRRRMSESAKRRPMFVVKRGVYERSAIEKKRLAELCRKNCINRRPSYGMLGKQHSSKTIATIRDWCRQHPELLGSSKGRKLTPEQRKKWADVRRGPKSHLWQGGKTKKNGAIRNSLEYRQWREAVFTRDGYLCVIGGKAHGHKIQADHIKPFALFPDLRLDITNGRTLCEECHKMTATYLSGTRSQKHAILH
jgi:5-methylcytosine-specific restriction endonuclease McrA